MSHKVRYRYVLSSVSTIVVARADEIRNSRLRSFSVVFKNSFKNRKGEVKYWNLPVLYFIFVACIDTFNDSIITIRIYYPCGYTSLSSLKQMHPEKWHYQWVHGETSAVEGQRLWPAAAMPTPLWHTADTACIRMDSLSVQGRITSSLTSCPATEDGTTARHGITSVGRASTWSTRLRFTLTLNVSVSGYLEAI